MNTEPKQYRKKPIVITAYQTDNIKYIETLEGIHKADVGDYIITGIKGEQYPCKPDIFKKTYEPVKTDTPKISIGMDAENESDFKDKIIVPMTPQEFKEKISSIIHEEGFYTEVCHCDMDECMADLLKTLGYSDGIKIFEEYEKWYA